METKILDYFVFSFIKPEKETLFRSSLQVKANAIIQDMIEAYPRIFISGERRAGKSTML
jgi:hypothetical protein